jgi:glycerol-3-phosphate acyltransferase PlsY
VTIWIRIISLIIGYAFGSIPTGYLYAKANGIDIRKHGSGNIGMTNTMRTLGVKAGVITLAGDFGKAIVAIAICMLLFYKQTGDWLPVVKLYAGLGAVLGHNFCPFLKFHGGKAIATSAAVMTMFAPFELPITVGLFLLIVIITHVVSIGSIVGVSTFVIQTVIFGLLGVFDPMPQEALIECYILTGIISALGVIRHKDNIKRLIRGEEKKFTLGKKETAAKEEQHE